MLPIARLAVLLICTSGNAVIANPTDTISHSVKKTLGVIAHQRKWYELVGHDRKKQQQAPRK